MAMNKILPCLTHTDLGAFVQTPDSILNFGTSLECMNSLNPFVCSFMELSRYGHARCNKSGISSDSGALH